MKACFESVIIEVKAARAGEEVTSDGGIVIGRRETGEIPEIGTIISVGKHVPADAADILLNKKVLIPHARMEHVVDPRVVDGTLVIGEKPRQLTATHWKNIQVVY